MNEYYVIAVLITIIIVMAVTLVRNKVKASDIGFEFPSNEELISEGKKIFIRTFGKTKGKEYFNLLVDYILEYYEYGSDFVALKINDMIPKDKQINTVALKGLVDFIFDAVIDVDMTVEEIKF